MKNLYLTLIALITTTVAFSQIISFPDANFKNALLAATTTNNIAQDVNSNSMVVDANGNNEIEVSEALAVYELNVSSNSIANLGGIENFTNLTFLNCGLNQITSLDVTALNNLQNLRCTNNGMTNLVVNGLSNLLVIEAFSNQLTTLNLTGLSALTDLKLSNNQLTTLDVSGLSNIEYIVASYMDLATLTLGTHPNLDSLEFVNTVITEVDLSGCPALQTLICYGSELEFLVLNDLENLQNVNATDNQIGGISLTNTPALSNLNVSQNQLVFLDASGSTGLNTLSCNNNLLEAIIIKNGIEENLYFGENPNLQYICCDPEQVATITAQVTQLFLNTHVNSYCTLTPGGKYYNINGVTTFDFGNDGCDPTETPVPHQQFQYTNNGDTATIFGAPNGNYVLYPREGITTLIPVMENPDYFTITPTSLTVDFPTDPTPFVQNFCVTSNGNFPDLDIVIVSLGFARPGFESSYRILYNNKGNQMLSGDFTLTYLSDLMVYLSGIPESDSQTTNTLTWNFTNLEPFQGGFVDVTFLINTPTDTPPVELGDILTFTAIITPIAGDVTPLDNEFVLQQTVVGSFDPNDITCLQGESVAPETVGDYVHYRIRFENTGTFAAENIVVKNEIDLSKFDMDSFRPISGSHPFITRIVDDNTVEFVFEDIQLPFDDANNDGFVLYKIRTLPTLVEGDTFSNLAEIYFDFNPPIITNTFITTVETQLGVDDIQNNNGIKLYPNPAHDILHVSAPSVMDGYEIINLLGQTVASKQMNSNAYSIDVSSLSAGQYFIKLNSAGSIEHLRFIRK